MRDVQYYMADVALPDGERCAAGADGELVSYSADMFGGPPVRFPTREEAERAAAACLARHPTATAAVNGKSY
jgi:hypothetical protein